MDIRACGFSRSRAGKECCAAASVITGTIGSGPAVGLFQPFDDLQVILEVIEGLHRFIKFEI
jgi:hypothetical protein